MYMPDIDFQPLLREEYSTFTGPDPWGNDCHTTWQVNGYQMQSASVTPPYPPGKISTQAVFVGITSECRWRYRILPMALQDLWREGVLRGPELPALLYATEEGLRLSDYPPPFKDLYLRIFSITFAALTLLGVGVAIWIKIDYPYYFSDILTAGVLPSLVLTQLPTGILILHRFRRRRLVSMYRALIASNVASAPA
jgi:hypothetical protein